MTLKPIPRLQGLKTHVKTPSVVFPIREILHKVSRGRFGSHFSRTTSVLRGWKLLQRPASQSRDRLQSRRATQHWARGETTSSAAWHSCGALVAPPRAPARAKVLLAGTAPPRSE